MKYQNFINTDLASNVSITANEPILNEHLGEIESIVGKKLPSEFVEFYSFCDGLQWRFSNSKEPYNDTLPSSSEEISSLSVLFDEYKFIPPFEHEEWDEDLWYQEVEYFNSNIYLEDLSWDNELIDISSKEGLRHYSILRNMKLLSSLNGHEGNIVIDFTDTNASYKLYYQVYEELYVLNISLELFFKIFLQIGMTAHWFKAFIDEADRGKYNSTYQEVDFKIIEYFFPKFDMSVLQNPSNN